MRSVVIISLALTSLALSAAAEPITRTLNQATVDTPLEGTGNIPDSLLLSTVELDLDGGGQGTNLYPTITLSTHNPWDAPLEISLGDGLTNDGLDFGNRFFDELPAGSVLDGSLVSNWYDPFDGSHGGESLTELAAFTFQPWECTNRTTINYIDEFRQSLDDGVYYIGFRWIADDSARRYGWAAFKFTNIEYTGSQTCKDMDYSFLYEASVTYIAAGWETEPDTAITVGGGMCRGDFNFDATVDFFDVSDFVQAWADQDQSADINLDGSINFFDISDFLTRYQEECNL